MREVPPVTAPQSGVGEYTRMKLLHHKKKHGHPDRLIVRFTPDSEKLAAAAGDALRVLYQFELLGVDTTMKIFTNDTKGLNLTISEILAASGQVFPSAGPFQVDVTD